MRQVLMRRGQVNVEQVPAPLVEPGHVLVEVAYSLISSGTEIAGVAQSRKSLVQRALEKPEQLQKVVDHLKAQGIHKTVAKVRGRLDQVSALGYSCSGIVLQVGDGVTNIHPGDRVACAGAQSAKHAEIVLSPHNLLVKVPDDCTLRDAAAVTLGAIAMQGVRRADPRLGEIVAVIGLGLVGQLTVQLLKAAGCLVIGLDVDARRIQLAQQAGIDAALNAAVENAEIENEIRHLTGGHGVDATIITASSSSDAIVAQAMQITRKKGRVIVVGDVGLGLTRSPFYDKEIDFLISCSYGPGRYDEAYEEKGVDYPYAYVRWTENRNLQEFLRLAALGKIRLDTLLEQEYELEHAGQAYAALQASVDKPIGVLLRYHIDVERGSAQKLATKIRLQDRPANGKVQIAVVGAGGFAKGVHLPNLQQLAELYQIRAIVSSTGSNAQITAQQFGADYASTNYQDVLDDPAVDAVLICTRHNLHAEQAIQAARAGKAILVEKPMALHQVELDQLVAVLEETQVPFMVGFNRRFSPAAKRAKEIVSTRQNPLMILYRMNAGYVPPEHWIQTEEGGGRIVGEACHILDLFQYLIGAPIVEVNSTTIAPTHEHVLASDNISVTLRYEDGSVATLFYASLGASDFGKEYMEIYSDGKVLVLDDYRSLAVKGSKQTGWSAPQQDKGHREELRVFADFTQARIPAPISLAELASVTRTTIQL